MKNKKKDYKFPETLYIGVANQGEDDEYFVVGKTPEEVTRDLDVEVGDTVVLGVYDVVNRLGYSLQLELKK